MGLLFICNYNVTVLIQSSPFIVPQSVKFGFNSEVMAKLVIIQPCVLNAFLGYEIPKLLGRMAMYPNYLTCDKHVIS